jgi:3-carboxy-cis,cis-muconate cycloisomerase
MPRPEAQAAVKALCAQAIAEGRPLPELARAAHPGLPAGTFDAQTQTGTAPAAARAFAARVRKL